MHNCDIMCYLIYVRVLKGILVEQKILMHRCIPRRARIQKCVFSTSFFVREFVYSVS